MGWEETGGCTEAAGCDETGACEEPGSCEETTGCEMSVPPEAALLTADVAAHHTVLINQQIGMDRRIGRVIGHFIDPLAAYLSG